MIVYVLPVYEIMLQSINLFIIIWIYFQLLCTELWLLPRIPSIAGQQHLRLHKRPCYL